MSKVEFKEFVSKNPHLIDVVSSGKTSWQKLYEIFDLYGDTSTVWDNYKENKTSTNTTNQTTSTNSSPNNFKDLLNMVKGIDLESVRKGLNSLDKAIDAFKDLVPSKSVAKDLYEARPTYKYFED